MKSIEYRGGLLYRIYTTDILMKMTLGLQYDTCQYVYTIVEGKDNW